MHSNQTDHRHPADPPAPPGALLRCPLGDQPFSRFVAGDTICAGRNPSSDSDLGSASRSPLRHLGSWTAAPLVETRLRPQNLAALSLRKRVRIIISSQSPPAWTA